jgi:Spy/CpxP family protein refolding chaperone
MRAMQAWRIVDELRLDEKTAGRMVAVLGAYDEREIALLAERHDITYELQGEATAAHPDDSRLLRTIDRLAEIRSRIHALHTERFAALRKVLSPVQQAKLLLLLHLRRLDRDWHERPIRDAK